MGKGQSTKRRSTKANDIDWEIVRAENLELIEMAATTKIWPLKHLKRLHQQ
jgi:hypothetical protein